MAHEADCEGEHRQPWKRSPHAPGCWKDTRRRDRLLVGRSVCFKSPFAPTAYPHTYIPGVGSGIGCLLLHCTSRDGKQTKQLVVLQDTVHSISTRDTQLVKVALRIRWLWGFSASFSNHTEYCHCRHVSIVN